MKFDLGKKTPYVLKQTERVGRCLGFWTWRMICCEDIVVPNVLFLEKKVAVPNQDTLYAGLGLFLPSRPVQAWAEPVSSPTQTGPALLCDSRSDVRGIGRSTATDLLRKAHVTRLCRLCDLKAKAEGTRRLCDRLARLLSSFQGSGEGGTVVVGSPERWPSAR